MLPLRLGSHPAMGSRGSGSTCGTDRPALVPVVATKAQEFAPLGSNGLLGPMLPPFRERPNKQSTLWRQVSILPEGWVLALTLTEAAPTPCRRTGFHITSISLY